MAVLQTTQTASSFVTAATGTLTYSPNGTVLDGKDFTDFLTAGQKNSAVTGELLQPLPICLAQLFASAAMCLPR